MPDSIFEFAPNFVIDLGCGTELLARRLARLGIAVTGVGGRFVFETRDPSRRAWERWTRAESQRRVEIDGVGRVETWVELTDVRLPLISFRHTWVFEADGAVLTSDSALRFRERAEVESDLRRHGYVVEVRDAPDRPELEFVFVASRTARITLVRGAARGPGRWAAG